MLYIPCAVWGRRLGYVCKYVYRYVYKYAYRYGFVHGFVYEPIGFAQTLKYTCSQLLMSHANHVRGLQANFASSGLHPLRPRQQLEEEEEGEVGQARATGEDGKARATERAHTRAAERAEGA